MADSPRSKMIENIKTLILVGSLIPAVTLAGGQNIQLSPGTLSDPAYTIGEPSGLQSLPEKKPTPEETIQEKIGNLTGRLGLPASRAGQAGDQIIVTLKKGDNVKLKLDNTFSRWNAVRDGSVILYATDDGIHTVLAHRETNSIFKTAFSSGDIFVVTADPQQLGILSFLSTRDPQTVYKPKPGVRYMQPWSKIPYVRGSLTAAQKTTLNERAHNLVFKFGLESSDYTITLRANQAVVSLKKDAILRTKPGITFVSRNDNDIKFFIDYYTANIGFHTLQIKKSSLKNIEINQPGDYVIWSFNKLKPYLTFHPLTQPKSYYTPLEYANDLFEPLDSEI